jgi:hypothetical protein
VFHGDKNRVNFRILSSIFRNHDSSAGIVNVYGLEDLGFESRWGTRFPAPVHTGSGAHPASFTMGIGFSSVAEGGGV